MLFLGVCGMFADGSGIQLAAMQRDVIETENIDKSYRMLRVQT
jgi:hypothetical protein